MSFQLKILPRAAADIQEMFDWVAAHSPDGADRWYAAFQGAARKVLTNPHGPAKAREDAFVEHDLRNFLFKTRRGRTYRGVFTVVGDEVRVLRVRGPGQPDLTADELPPGD